MYAVICPDCGAYLDPCERCDCKEHFLEAAKEDVVRTEDKPKQALQYAV